MSEYAPDFEGSLDELLSLIHQVATAQVVPDAIDNSWGNADRVTQIARAVSAEDAQLFYQMALNGKRDIALSPDSRRGFEMILLRMLAFRPAAVIDEKLGPEDLQDALPPRVVAGEGGAPVKKFPDVPVVSSVKGDNGGTSLDQCGKDSAILSDNVSAGDFRLESLSSDNWFELLELLGLAGIVYNIASHCELRDRTGDALQFILDEAHAALFNAGHRDKLRLALGNYFGHSISVSIGPGALHGETPAMRLTRLAERRQAEAVLSIESDSQLQALITRFDGELDRSSIHPIDV